MNRAKMIALQRPHVAPSSRGSVDVPPVPPRSKTQKKPCGCDKRKAWLNSVVPGAGDLVEAITTATGIKRLVQGPTESERATSDTAEARP